MIKALLKDYLLNKVWRKRNAHNSTKMIHDFDINLVKVGKCTYGGISVLNYNGPYKLKIGNFCSIAQKAVFIVSADHLIDRVSTYPFKVKIAGTEKEEAISKGDIIVDDDVWIGYGATILSGVHIGQGAVIAAGAVVTKDIPPYAIAAGVPAKVMKYRFNEELIEELLKVDFGKLEEGMVREHMDDLYEKLERKEQLAWLPKKCGNI